MALLCYSCCFPAAPHGARRLPGFPASRLPSRANHARLTLLRGRDADSFSFTRYEWPAGRAVPLRYSRPGRGAIVTYTLVSGASTGWAITGTKPNALGTVTVTTGTGDGVFSASTAGCTSTTANQTVKVRNNSSGCVWTIDRTQEGSGLYKMVSTNPACYPSRSTLDAPRVVDPLVTYTFTVVEPANPPATTVPTTTIINRLVNFFDNNLAGPYPLVGTTVTAEVLSPLTCLFGSTSVTLPRVAPSHPSSPSPSVGSQAVDRSREEVAAFPNPADQLIQIELARVVKGDAQLTLLDATGRVVRQQTATAASATLDTHDLPHGLPHGLYSLRVRLASGNVYTQPIAISH